MLSNKPHSAARRSVAPTVPEPFVPVVSTPLKLSTVMDWPRSWKGWLQPHFLKGWSRRLRGSVLRVVRFTNDQVRPAPAMLFTCMVLPTVHR